MSPSHLRDTIVARATPAGVGAVSLVRLSGPEARAIADRLIAPGPGASALEVPDTLPERVPTLCWIRDPESGEPLDQALVTVFPGPDSYTGEDVVELSCHGGWLTPELVIEACRSLGARGAEPGEFTRRAYLAGRVDLVQAEATLDLIESRSPAGRAVALRQLDRGLSERVAELRRALVGLEALLVHHIDFPEEDDPPVSLAVAADRSRGVLSRIDALLETAPEGELLRDGALTVLAGPPNAGKSSLFNALLGSERAIVTDTAGTTRDAIEAVVSMDGYPFRLVDTAGLREGAGEIERLGIEVATRYLAGADVILFVVDGSTDAERALNGPMGVLLRAGGAPVVLVRSKADLEVDPAPATVGSSGARPETPAGGAPPAFAAAPVVGGAAGYAAAVSVSALRGDGLRELRSALTRVVFGGLAGAASRGAAAGDPGAGLPPPVVTRRRQARALEQARDEVHAFARALDEGVPPEVASAHVRAAETALEEVLGVVTQDEVLDRLFADFCIGK